MDPRLTLVKNVAANLVRGGASALVALALPYFLTRSLPAEKYSVWVLALQLSAYVGCLDLGIQTAVARFIAQALERNEAIRRDQIISSAGLMLTVVMLAGLAALGVGFALLPVLYPQLATTSISELRYCMLLIGGSLAVGLPASVYTALLIASECNEITALAIGGSKLLGAAAVIAASTQTQSLAALASIIAAANLLSYAIQYGCAARITKSATLRIQTISKPVIREVSQYCFSLSAWSIGMLLVSGLDLTLVGLFDLSHVGAYSIGNTFVLAVAGVNGAISAALLAPMSRLHARQGDRQLGRYVVNSSRIALFVNILLATPILIFSRHWLQFWVAHEYVAAAEPILIILVIANVLRTAFSPYSVAVISSGQQKVVVLAPVVEGVTNLAASVVGGFMFGAKGVALGTLTGAVISVVWWTLYCIPRIRDIVISQREFLLQAVLRPMVYLAPVWLVLIARASGLCRDVATLCIAAGVSACVLVYMETSPKVKGPLGEL